MRNAYTPSGSPAPLVRWGAIAAAALVAASMAGPANADPTGPQVVASGLNNPRHLTVAATGDIFVAEAGTGGAGPCFPSPEDPADVVCSAFPVPSLGSPGPASRGW